MNIKKYSWYCKCTADGMDTIQEDELGDYYDVEEVELKIEECLHSAILSMGKYREGEIKEALDEFLILFCEHIGLELVKEV